VPLGGLEIRDNKVRLRSRFITRYSLSTSVDHIDRQY